MKRVQKRSGKGGRNVRALAMVLGTVLLVAVCLYYVLIQRTPPQDLETILANSGLTLNQGLAATLGVGDVLQLIEADNKGTPQVLPRPVIFLRREDCFPEQAPITSHFPMPSMSGQRTGSLVFAGKEAAKYLPNLKLEGAALRDYALTIRNPRMLSFAKGDLSENFSAFCVERFELALKNGDKAEWFGTVIETLEADGITLTLGWKAGADAAVRSKVLGAARKTLAPKSIRIGIDSNDQTTLVSEEHVVLGFRVRPMQPVFSD